VGDKAAIAIVWDRYSRLVRGVLFGALGPDQAIEDLVQEVFVGFIRGASHIQDGAALRGYLASLAVRQAALEIRKRKVRRWVGLTPTGELPEQSTPRGPELEHRHALEALHRVLERLSTRRRMTFLLRQVQGLEIIESARALGVSESTFRRELQFAKDFITHSASSEPALATYLAGFTGD
jgi:RNA polymerase sigma-70 factor (ECF subfamily)